MGRLGWRGAGGARQEQAPLRPSKWTLRLGCGLEKSWRGVLPNSIICTLSASLIRSDSSFSSCSSALQTAHKSSLQRSL